MKTETESSKIRFGTDGWRGVNDLEFNHTNLGRVVQAYAEFLRSRLTVTNRGAKVVRGDRTVIIGYDCRQSSLAYGRLTAGILNENGFDSLLFAEPVPTPFVSWAVKNTGALGGCVITASHNPHNYNGFKIKEDWGGSAGRGITKQVEDLIDRRTTKFDPKCEVLTDRSETDRILSSYREQLGKIADLEKIRSFSGTVILDAMHGSAGRLVEDFLSPGLIRGITIRDLPDRLFGGVNPEPVDQNLGLLKRTVIQKRAFIGLATDGDADRVGAVDQLGRTMTMHEIAPLLLLHLHRVRHMTGAVVTTFSQSVLVKRIAKALGLEVIETPIGFKYIAELMRTRKILIGAEESGGIGFIGHIPERDGILSSLLILESVIAAGKPVTEIVADIQREFGAFFYDRFDAAVPVRSGQAFVDEIGENPPLRIDNYDVVKVKRLDGTKLVFEDDSWLLFRQSGTEPVLRIYAEAASELKTKRLIQSGRTLLRKYLSSQSSYSYAGA